MPDEISCELSEFSCTSFSNKPATNAVLYKLQKAIEVEDITEATETIEPSSIAGSTTWTSTYVWSENKSSATSPEILTSFNNGIMKLCSYHFRPLFCLVLSFRPLIKAVTNLMFFQVFLFRELASDRNVGSLKITISYLLWGGE